MDNIKAGVYRHYKGGQVFVIGSAKHSETNEELVAYIGMQDKRLHFRPLNSFVETINCDNKMVNRFCLEKIIEFDISSVLNEVGKI